MPEKTKIDAFKNALTAIWKAEPELQVLVGLNSFINIFIIPDSDTTPYLPASYIGANDENRIISKIKQAYDQCFGDELF